MIVIHALNLVVHVVRIFVLHVKVAGLIVAKMVLVLDNNFSFISVAKIVLKCALMDAVKILQNAWQVYVPIVNVTAVLNVSLIAARMLIVPNV